MTEGKHTALLLCPGFRVECPDAGCYASQGQDEPEWKFCPMCGERLKFQIWSHMKEAWVPIEEWEHYRQETAILAKRGKA